MMNAIFLTIEEEEGPIRLLYGAMHGLGIEGDFDVKKSPRKMRDPALVRTLRVKSKFDQGGSVVSGSLGRLIYKKGSVCIGYATNDVNY